MQAHTHTPAANFGHHVRYLVPLFQRPYVWNQENQWEPLWADVRVVAERLQEAERADGPGQVPPHFLGAIVLDQPQTQTGFIAARHIVDGQQRLTTLQLLLDAAQWVVERHGAAMDAHALRVLVLNEPAIALEQAQQMFTAAASVGVATRPLLLFYGLSQGGRAIAGRVVRRPFDLRALVPHSGQCRARSSEVSTCTTGPSGPSSTPTTTRPSRPSSREVSSTMARGSSVVTRLLRQQA